MSLYVVVEGRRTEPRLYRAWLPLLFPGMQPASRIEDAEENHFFLVAGHGYPSYLRRIEGAVADLALEGSPFTHLVVCVDAEEDTHEARLDEVESAIRRAHCPVDFTVVVADCCIETWLLGHRKLIKRNPDGEKLRAYLRHYDVSEEDPEGIPPMGSHRTRAALCLDYLKAAFGERNQRYSKANPGHATTGAYFNALCERATPAPQGTGHLRSFGRLLELRERVKLARER